MIGMSVCSGIGAPEISAPWIDWRYQSEIEQFPSAVLAHRFPHAVNRGDMTKFKEWPDATVDVLVGGTPCQSFSVAGLRRGLDDPRGNLMLTYLAIAERYKPRWLVWENVPGVFSSVTDDIPDPCPPSIDLDGPDGPEDGETFVVEDEHDGCETHALGCFFAGLSELGYGFAYRVLDAQYVRAHGFPRAVPQRRRRVFVVGYLGDWRRAAAVLFDGESLRGNPPPRREAQQRTATIPARSLGGGGLGTDFDCDGGLISAAVAPTLNAHFGDKMGLENQHINGGCGHFVAHALRGEGFDASEDGTTPLVPVAYGLTTEQTPKFAADHALTLTKQSPTGGGQPQAVAFDPNQVTSKANRSVPRGDVLHTLPATTAPPHLAAPWAVRRLTPREFSRSMGFPDDWAKIPYRGKPADQCPDGPQYKAYGNSWAVNCGRLIFDRMRMVEERWPVTQEAAE